MASSLQDPQPVAHPRLLTVAEAAKELRISTSFLYELIAKGKVPGVVRLGRVIRIDIDTLREKGVSS